MPDVIIRRLPVKLTREEREVRASDLAERLRAADAKEAEAKAVAANFKGELEAIKKTARKLRDAVHTNHELRDVECYELPRPSKRMVDILREDTHEVVDTREMTETERQVVLFPTPRTASLAPVVAPPRPVTLEANAERRAAAAESAPQKHKREPKRRQTTDSPDSDEADEATG